MKEIWRPVVGYKGKFEVSNLGRVKSLSRYARLVHWSGTVSRRRVRSRILKPGKCWSGHLSVSLSGRSFGVHLLVLKAFVGPRPKGKESLHKNHKPWDNRLRNLKYGTRSENIKMDYAAGSRTSHFALSKVHPRWKTPKK